MTKTASIPTMIPRGTALNNSVFKSWFLSICTWAAPSIRLPPDEKGEIDELCAPITMQINSNKGFNPEAMARAGTIGNRVGATTPSVLANTDMIALMMNTKIGIIQIGTMGSFLKTV